MWPGPGYARSGGEPVAAPEPAGLDDRPSGAGRHATAEAVLLRPRAVVGRVGAFHSALRRVRRTAGRLAPARWAAQPLLSRGGARATVPQPSHRGLRGRP